MGSEVNAMFVLALMFSKKLVIFQRTFFGKLSHCCYTAAIFVDLEL